MTDLSTLSDTDLLQRFHAVPWEAGEPEHEALLGEIQKRELDI
jgi:hypothetical protein